MRNDFIHSTVWSGLLKRGNFEVRLAVHHIVDYQTDTHAEIRDFLDGEMLISKSLFEVCGPLMLRESVIVWFLIELNFAEVHWLNVMRPIELGFRFQHILK